MEPVNIGEYRITSPRFRHTLPGLSGCDHKKLSYHEHGEILTCEDCKQQVSAIWALRRLVEAQRQERESLDFQRRSLAAERERGITLRAAQAIEDAWRSKKALPCCPHCKKAILPQHRFGMSRVARGTEAASGAMMLTMQSESNDSASE